MPAEKVLKLNGADFEEVAGIQTSAGVGDAGKLICGNASGVLDTTFLPVGGYDTRYLQLSGGTMTGNITLAGDPSSALHPTSKQYVDNLIAGLKWKNSVKACSTANITLSGSQTIDGIVVNTGDRVLVKNQTTQTENGIYIVQASSWVRATDADSSVELVSSAVFVEQGTVNADTAWTCSNDTITIGSTNIVFAQFTGAASITAGAGLTKTGNQIDIGAGNGIQVNADDVQVKLDGATLAASVSGLKVTDNTYAPYAHVGATGTAHGNATTSVNGFMLSTDKTKLDGVAAGAQVNQNAFSNVAVSGQTTVSASSATDTVTLVAGVGHNITTSGKNISINSDAKTMVALEALSALDMVNVFNDSGTLKSRKANATDNTKRCHGFVLAGVSAGANSIVYFQGIIGGFTGLTVGSMYYLSTTGGGITATPPSTAGNVVQELGIALSATEIYFNAQKPVKKA